MPTINYNSTAIPTNFAAIPQVHHNASAVYPTKNILVMP